MKNGDGFGKILCFHVTRVLKRLHHAGMRPHPCPRVTIAASSDSRHDRFQHVFKSYGRGRHPGRLSASAFIFVSGRPAPAILLKLIGGLEPATALHPVSNGGCALRGAPSASSCRTPICCSIARVRKSSAAGRHRSGLGLGGRAPRWTRSACRAGRTTRSSCPAASSGRRSPAPSSTAPPSSSPTSPPPISTMTATHHECVRDFSASASPR